MDNYSARDRVSAVAHLPSSCHRKHTNIYAQHLSIAMDQSSALPNAHTCTRAQAPYFPRLPASLSRISLLPSLLSSHPQYSLLSRSRLLGHDRHYCGEEPLSTRRITRVRRRSTSVSPMDIRTSETTSFQKEQTTQWKIWPASRATRG